MAQEALTLLGLGDMGTALARTWLAAGHPVTAWNRTPARAARLTGATTFPTAAEAVAANRLVVACLLDDASVRETLRDADLDGKDVVNLTTSTPDQARELAKWVEDRGARFLAGGIMAVPPMIGNSGYVFYSGSEALFAEHEATLAVPVGTKYVGADAGFAALHDVALLSAMSGAFAGISHAFALVRREDVRPSDFAELLVGWLTAMMPYVHGVAEHLESGDYTKGVVSNLAMQVAGNATLLRTAEEQGVSPELLTPYMNLMAQRLADGHGTEGTTGVIDLLLR
ncbi:NAD(P)-dependent oxidoreductase [Saccharothrix obliqua]|uniref:NAD(P)-dependent oxidoreductase n=1 Tax=Saccharothrix obliqua TaxID=2861747 RepID=UPI0021508B61|nr:NAD(P)-binding domain-containing protein [Saccharothrix obliqua]